VAIDTLQQKSAANSDNADKGANGAADAGAAATATALYVADDAAGYGKAGGGYGGLTTPDQNTALFTEW
jgi:hypothetical protein